MESEPPWFVTPPSWTGNHKSELLSPKNNQSPPPDLTVMELMEKSSKFPRKFPIESVRCYQLLKFDIPQDVLQRNINSTYPIIHEHALYLCSIFLNHQKKFGNRKFYKDMSLLDFVERLLSKRAASFTDEEDNYLLMDGNEGFGGWEDVGTEKEKPPLTLENCLSYDEMKLSAFLSVSSRTIFLNDGNRLNRGVFEKEREKIEEDGVIVGLIGPRLPKPHVMEYREVMKTPEQNNHRYGYGNFFVPTFQGQILNFYGDVSITFDQLLPQMQNSSRYVNIVGDYYFDKLVYSRRLFLSIDTLLLEANSRAKELDKMAYVHVVGIGLGVWKIYDQQDEFFMDAFLQRLQFLSDVLTNISDICFAYIKHKMAGSYKNGDFFGKIKLHMVDKSGPHLKLTDEDAGKLLVVSYAWDCNALPGNEFWVDSLDSSSDPAAACSTQVAELHNWHINDKVSGRNLRVATLKAVVTFKEYQEMHKDD